MRWMLFLFFSLSLQAQTSNTLDHRSQSHGTVLGGYHLLSTWIPSKWALSYTQIFTPQWSLEGEYARGSLGLGLLGFNATSVTEDRYSLLVRRYIGNSFHFILGGFKNEFRARLGNDILDEMSNQRIDEFRVSGYGLVLGLGNRWQWGRGFTLGVDWFRMNVPLIEKRVDNDVLDNIDDRNDLSRVRRTIDRIKNIPTFIVLGLQLGYTF